MVGSPLLQKRAICECIFSLPNFYYSHQVINKILGQTITEMANLLEKISSVREITQIINKF
jgi:hypothetical protein